MFHIYCDGYRITDTPKSINYITHILFKNSQLNLALLYNLSIDGHYQFREFVFVREI